MEIRVSGIQVSSEAGWKMSADLVVLYFLITRLASGNTPHNIHGCYQHITSCCLSNLKHSMKLLSEMSLAGYNFIQGLLTGSICRRCIPGECWW